MLVSKNKQWDLQAYQLLLEVLETAIEAYKKGHPVEDLIKRLNTEKDELKKRIDTHTYPENEFEGQIYVNPGFTKAIDYIDELGTLVIPKPG